MNDQPNKIISFAEFELDTVRRRLIREGEVVPLHAKAFDLLSFLARNNGNIVTKDEILDAVWENQFVEESNLAVQISNLRKALGETKNSPRFLVTIPGKGYRFVADVDENTLIIETHSISEMTIEQVEAVKPTQLAFVSNRNLNLKWLALVGFVILSTVGFGWFWNRNPQTTKPNKQVKLSKLTSSGKIMNATMSPDGKFAVFSQKDAGGESLWLRQLDSGSDNQIVASQPLEYVGLTVSPDNQYIYASTFSNNVIDASIYKIPLIGGVPQQIPNIAIGVSISISPDGKRFAFTESNSGEKETMFGVADIDGSNKKYLIRAKHDTRFFENFKSSSVAWSPDGSEVAVAVLDKTENGAFASILMVNPNDGSERYLSDKKWKSVSNPTWLDTDTLAFIAAQEKDDLANQVWTISRKTGEAKQITNQLQNYVWLAANNGKILAVQLNTFSSLRVADFNEAEKSLKIREIFTASDYIDEIDWSKNGDIVYGSRESGKSELWQRKNDGTNAKQLTFDANIKFGLTVSPTTGTLIFAAQQNGKRGIWQSDADGKNFQQISEGNDLFPDVSNDGKVVFHRGIGYAEGIFLASPNVMPRILREKCYYPAISPDGAQTACYFMDWEDSQKWQIALVSNETGALIRKISLPITIYSRKIRWHSSGKFLTQIISVGENLKLILLPTNGNQPHIIDGLGKGESNVPEWSPDGKQFLYPLITTTQDAVMLTDF